AGGLDPVGVAYALVAALAWALYIVFGQRAGRVDGGQAVSLGMLAAALVVAPFGLASSGAALFDPATLVLGFGIAVLSSALPYSLEMVALRRLTRQAFGVMMSLEPAIAALAALILLGERLSPLQWLAIGCVIAASAGITAGGRRAAKAAAMTP
ncbi:EamA family transporter, partial [Methylobacterium sp. WL122]